MTLYTFSIAYLDEGSTIRTYEEQKEFLNEGSAYIYFEDLCCRFNVGPYYYLCKWGEVITDSIAGSDSFGQKNSCQRR